MYKNAKPRNNIILRKTVRYVELVVARVAIYVAILSV